LFLDGGLSVSKFKQLTLDETFQPISLSKLRGKKSLQLAFDKAGVTGSNKKIRLSTRNKAKVTDNRINNINKSSRVSISNRDIPIVNSSAGVLPRKAPASTIFSDKITDDESAYLEYYKGEGFYKSNKILRDRGNYSANEIADAQRMNDTINSAIGKSILDDDLVMYRGIRSSELFNSIDDSAVGALIPIGTPQSFSRDGKVGLTYSGAMKVGDDYVSAGSESVILRLNAKKGQSALDMERLSGIGDTSESEMLLSSNGNYKIIGTEDRFSPDGQLSLKIIDVEYDEGSP
jgi:hypothetical protein